ncbi:MAG: efflux RND transporter periplasmic adaptor subunit [Rhodocyclaceae bacterium]
MNRTPRIALFAAAIAMLAACEQAADGKKTSTAPPTLITVTRAGTGTIEVGEQTLGTLEAVLDPKVGAEVAGRVLRMLVEAGKAVKKGELLAVIDEGDTTLQMRADEAEIRRIEALLAQQERLVERQRQLVQKGFISPNAAEDAQAQRDALRENLAAARVKRDQSRRSEGKTRVTAPFDGVVEARIASAGDFVRVGDPLLRLVSSRKLRAHLPLPETSAAHLRPGLPVRIRSPQRPGRTIQGVIADIRPTVSEGSRAVDAIVEIDNDGSLRSGGSVDAFVIFSRKEGAILVPEHGVVLRPAGKVVYVIDGENKARARTVRTGARQEGRVEILAGLAAGETIALDGAGFLSEGAPVRIARPAGEHARAAGAQARK